MEPNRFHLHPTRGTLRRRGDFLCRLNDAPPLRRLFRWSRLVVVSRDAGDGTQLTTIARLELSADVPEGVAQVDQTLRKALGLADSGAGRTVGVYPLRRPARQRFADAAARLVGAQYVHFRVYKSAIVDAEKPVCRVGSEVFGLVGCTEGDVILCETAVRDAHGRWRLNRVRLRALPTEWLPVSSGNSVLTDSQRVAVAADVTERNAPAPHDPDGDAPVIGTPGDLRPVRLDQEARDSLAVVRLGAVRVRRDVRRRVIDGIRDFGIAFLLSLAGAAPIVTEAGVPASTFYPVVVIAALIYVFSKLRSEVP